MQSAAKRAEEADGVAKKANLKVEEQRDRLAHASQAEKRDEERLFDIMRHNASVADLVKSLNADEP